MKKRTHLKTLYLFLITALFSFSACQKDDVTTGDQETTMAKEEAIGFTLNSSISGSPGSDSLFVMEGCKRGNKKEEITLDALPDSAEAYLTTNYSGYTKIKAFKIISRTTSQTDSYVTIVLFNGKPVALKFDANGKFVQVMELREARDLKGKGWHLGGWFEHRDGKHRDTIAISALPQIVKLYFTTHFASDTLVYAVEGRDQSILVISNDAIGFYATAFTASGTFIKRVNLSAFKGKGQSVTLTELPATAQTYLSTTYPGFVFKKALAIKVNGTLKGYLTVIDANATKYAIHFDATGKFISSVAIR